MTGCAQRQMLSTQHVNQPQRTQQPQHNMLQAKHLGLTTLGRQYMQSMQGGEAQSTESELQSGSSTPLGPMLMRVGSMVKSSGWTWTPIASIWKIRGEIWISSGLMLTPCSAKVMRQGATLKSCSLEETPVCVTEAVKGAFWT